MNERELAAKALNKLEFHTGLVAKMSNDDNLATSAIIQFNDSKAKLVAELKKWNGDGDAQALAALINDVTQSKDKLLICDYVSEAMGAQLREAKLNYIDKAGNAFLDIAPIFVFIQGKSPVETVDVLKIERLFNETGLKVVLALLANENLLNASYRKVADHANVSMGTIGWVLRELKDMGYIEKDCNSHSWIKRSALARKWAEAYPDLKTKYRIGTYYAETADWWQTVNLQAYDAALGGELAALSYSSHTQPKSAVIYTGKHKHHRLIRDLNLQQSAPPKGKRLFRIEILEKYWAKLEDLSLLHNSTHPLITYADLLDTWDSGNRRVAKEIAEKYFSN